MESELYQNKKEELAMNTKVAEPYLSENSFIDHIRSEVIDKSSQDIMSPKLIDTKSEDIAVDEPDQCTLKEEPVSDTSLEEQFNLKAEPLDYFMKDEYTNEAQPLEDPNFVAMKEEQNTVSSSYESLLEEDFKSFETTEEYTDQSTAHHKKEENGLAKVRNIPAGTYSENNKLLSASKTVRNEKSNEGAQEVEHLRKSSHSDDLNVAMFSKSLKYNCSHCNKAFSLKNTMRRHMRIHSGEKPYKCCQCKKAFSRRNHMVIHMRMHSGEKPFKCSRCDMSFTSRGVLTNHMRIHSGEKPYKCSQCDKVFTRSDGLTVHMRIHSGKKPYKCSQCNKAFSQRSHVKSHMRTHSRQKIYKCN